jgi:protein subunit release factor B
VKSVTFEVDGENDYGYLKRKRAYTDLFASLPLTAAEAAHVVFLAGCDADLR